MRDADNSFPVFRGGIPRSRLRPWMLIFIDLLSEYGIESVYALKANE